MREHYQQHLHAYAMNTETRRVWDFAGMTFFVSQRVYYYGCCCKGRALICCVSLRLDRGRLCTPFDSQPA